MRLRIQVRRWELALVGCFYSWHRSGSGLLVREGESREVSRRQLRQTLLHHDVGVKDKATISVKKVVFGTNVSLPGDKDRVNNGSEHVRLNTSQRSSETGLRSSSGKLSVELARNSHL